MKKHVMEELVALFLEIQEDLQTEDEYEVIRFLRESTTNAIIARREEDSLDELGEDEDADDLYNEDLPHWRADA